MTREQLSIYLEELTKLYGFNFYFPPSVEFGPTQYRNVLHDVTFDIFMKEKGRETVRYGGGLIIPKSLSGEEFQVTYYPYFEYLFQIWKFQFSGEAERSGK